MSRFTQVRARLKDKFRIQDYHLLRWAFPIPFHYLLPMPYRTPYNPGYTKMQPVWANPPSLAATKGISFDFFSSGYLDGSVPQVSLHTPIYSTHNDWYLPDGLPHSGTPGSKDVCS